MTTILIGTDLSDEAKTAANWGFRFADLLQPSQDSIDIMVVTVVGVEELSTRRIVSQRDTEAELEAARQEVRDWLGELATGELPFEVEVHIGSPARTLAEVAEEKAADYLVVGQSGKGRLARVFLGTTAEHLAINPPCKVAMIHTDGYDWEKPVKAVSAIDLGASAASAMVAGAQLLRAQGGSLTLLHILELPKLSTGIADTAGLPQTLAAHLEDSSEWAREEIDTIVETHLPDTAGFALDVEIRPGYPSHEILHFLKDTQATLLTLGTQGRSRLNRFFMGSVGRGILKHAPCNILVAPPVPKADEE